MKNSVTAVFLVLLTAVLTVPPAQSSEPDPLFQSNDILQARLTGPLLTLIDEKSKENYLEGTFSVVDTDGTTLEFDLKFRARGNFRHDNCDYPPVRLNFKKSQTKDTLLDKQDKLKLVVHCNRRAEYHQIVLQEYLAYRIFNELSDLSFRVRLLQIVYDDPSEAGVSEPRYAFLIEHKDRLAKRIGLEELVTPRTQVGLIEGEYLNLTSIFQFFIGNTDFSPIAAAPGDDCCHNYVLFQNPGTNITAIPYDFDQSGFVDAPYANANPQFRLRSVKQRLYRGRCANNQHIEGNINKFQAIRDKVYDLIASQPGFDSSTRKDLVKFVDKFYELVDEPKRVQKSIVEKCV